MDNLEHKTIDKHLGERNFNTSEKVFSGLSLAKADYCLHGTCRDAVLGLKFNGDSTANNRLYSMQGSGGSASASVNNATTLPSVFGSTTAGKPSAFRLIITGDQNTEKFINSFVSLNSAVSVRAIYYKDALLDLTSITVYDVASRTATADIYLVQIPKGVNTDQYDLVGAIVGNGGVDTFTGLNGDIDEEYLVVTSDGSWTVDLNLTGTKTYQDLNNTNGAIGALHTTVAYNGIGQEVRIFAKSGRERLCTSSASKIVADQQTEAAIRDANTLDNVTQITVNGIATNDGYAYLYKKKPHKTIDPVPMDTLFEYEVGGDFSAGVTLSGLQCDRFEGAIKVEWITEMGAFAQRELIMRVNGDAESNYPAQNLIGYGASISAGAPVASFFYIGQSIDDGVSSGEFWLYPNSGQNRPSLARANLSDNPVSAGSEAVAFYYQLWNNLVDEITLIKIHADNTDSITGTIRICVPKGTTWTTKPTLTVN